jgi:hypothetical protein
MTSVNSTKEAVQTDISLFTRSADTGYWLCHDWQAEVKAYCVLGKVRLPWGKFKTAWQPHPAHGSGHQGWLCHLAAGRCRQKRSGNLKSAQGKGTPPACPAGWPLGGRADQAAQTDNMPHPSIHAACCCRFQTPASSEPRVVPTAQRAFLTRWHRPCLSRVGNKVSNHDERHGAAQPTPASEDHLCPAQTCTPGQPTAERFVLSPAKRAQNCAASCQLRLLDDRKLRWAWFTHVP